MKSTRQSVSKRLQGFKIEARGIAFPIRKFVNFGLEYWGSDQMGVNKTRRFLLEWLSFTCRYIPVGVLEVLPQRINERPPPFVSACIREMKWNLVNSIICWYVCQEFLGGGAFVRG